MVSCHHHRHIVYYPTVSSSNSSCSLHRRRRLIRIGLLHCPLIISTRNIQIYLQATGPCKCDRSTATPSHALIRSTFRCRCSDGSINIQSGRIPMHLSKQIALTLSRQLILFAKKTYRPFQFSVFVTRDKKTLLLRAGHTVADMPTTLQLLLYTFSSPL